MCLNDDEVYHVDRLYKMAIRGRGSKSRQTLTDATFDDVRLPHCVLGVAFPMNRNDDVLALDRTEHDLLVTTVSLGGVPEFCAYLDGLIILGARGICANRFDNGDLVSVVSKVHFRASKRERSYPLHILDLVAVHTYADATRLRVIERR